MTLVDPVFTPFSETMGDLFKDLDEFPERLQRGVYTTDNLNIRYQMTGLADVHPESFGVCDNPLQWHMQEGLRFDAEPDGYVACFIRMARDEQPETGGWRWHKWGRYIGTQEQTTEYLHDEPNVEAVYVFYVFRIRDDAELVAY